LQITHYQLIKTIQMNILFTILACLILLHLNHLFIIFFQITQNI